MHTHTAWYYNDDPICTAPRSHIHRGPEQAAEERAESAGEGDKEHLRPKQLHGKLRDFFVLGRGGRFERISNLEGFLIERMVNSY